MIHIAAILQSHQRREIDGIAHISRPTNLAGTMTKVGQNGVSANLMQGRLTMEQRQWCSAKCLSGRDQDLTVQQQHQQQQQKPTIVADGTALRSVRFSLSL